jgi:hypothetical protein
MAFKTITSATISGWTQGGATPDTITIGVAPVGLGFVVEDAGFTTLEQEPVLHDMCLLGNVLYIWANHNIYMFQGLNPDSFSMKRIITDIGIMGYADNYGQRALAVVKNKAYFIYDNNIYEFDGDSRPVIINRPVVLHDQSSNGIRGGFNMTLEAPWCLSATVNMLYVYSHYAFYPYYYVFDYETRTWWMYSGLATADITAAGSIYLKYVPSYSKDKMYNFITINSTTDGFFMATRLGITQSSAYPYIITKAYNVLPSVDESLTEINLMLEGTASESAAIELLYSLTVDSADFVSIVKYDKHIFNGDVEILNVPVPQDLIACVHHYRLKLVITPNNSAPVTVYNIERRFRRKGRTR